MNDRIRVLIADDHHVVRGGIRALLETETDIDVIDEAADGVETVLKTRSLNPDVILMDLMMPRKSGIEAIEEIKLAIEGLLEPTKEEKIVGQAIVREVFKISKVGTVAGCYLDEGKLTRNTHIRIVRDGIVIFPTREGATGEISSLKRFKEDVREVKSGLECGITIKNFNDIKVGDVIEGFEIMEIKQKLN